MQCPHCGQQAISLLRYTLRDRARLKCAACKTPLRQTRRHRRLAYLELAFVLPLLLSIPILVNVFGLPDDPTLAGVLALVVVLDIGYSRITWRIGEWETVEQAASDDDGPGSQTHAIAPDNAANHGDE